MSTAIPWTDHTINPGVYGCSPAGPGCLNCYAAKQARRLGRMAGCMDSGIEANKGFLDGPYAHVLPALEPYCGTTRVTKTERVGHGRPIESVEWTGKVRVDFDRIAPAFATLPKRKPARVFVTSMGDLFHEDVPNEFIARCFDHMAGMTWHTFQVLTKRPGWLLKWYEWASPDGHPLPPNVHIGFSASTPDDLAGANDLLQVPVPVLFLSLEPLLAPVDLTCVPWPAAPWPDHYVDVLRGGYWNQEGYRFGAPAALPDMPRGGFTNHSDLGGRIGHVIVGAESGPNRRPCRLEWVRSVVEQCEAAGVPVFVKQLDMDGRLSKDPAEWPEWARVQEFPEVGRG